MFLQKILEYLVYFKICDVKHFDIPKSLHKYLPKCQKRLKNIEKRNRL